MKLIKWTVLLAINIFLLEIALRFCGFVYISMHKVKGVQEFERSREDIYVLCLGESSTFGIGAEPMNSYPKQLEKKLKDYYGNDHIKVIAPNHVGNGTSQISARMGGYIRLYNPKLIILMAGVNNEVALTESNIVKFLNGTTTDIIKVKMLIILDSLRSFRFIRNLYMKFVVRSANFKHVRFINGGGRSIFKLLRPPDMPPAWIYAFAKKNGEAFVELWRYDIKKMIEEAKNKNINILLMTYHRNPAYLKSEEYVSMANNEKVLLVRNDETFEALFKKEVIEDYLSNDGWHPNKLGYSIIAKNAFEYIKSNDLLGLNASVKEHIIIRTR